MDQSPPKIHRSSPCITRGGRDEELGEEPQSDGLSGFGDLSSQVGRESDDQSRRIHVLGMGNVGVFVAHSLAGIPNRPPITLRLKGIHHLKQWRHVNETLSVTTRDMTDTATGFDIEFQVESGQDTPVLQMHTDAPRSTRPSTNSTPAVGQDVQMPGLRGSSMDLAKGDASIQEGHPDLSEPIGPATSIAGDIDQEVDPASNISDAVILHLIVATKAYAAAKAINHIKHRLTKDSTILFLQNGLGILEEVNRLCFQDPAQRPTYMVGVNTHGLKRQGKFFHVKHTGEGSIAIGIMPQPFEQFLGDARPLSATSASSQYLLRTMTRTPVFVAVGFPPIDLYQQQLDKLAINSVINPITAVLDTKNGAFNETFHLTRVLRLLLAETCHVIRNLPELRNIPNVRTRYDPGAIEHKIWAVTRATALNDSSMLQDVRAVNHTEIDYITGYIIRRAEELGMHCLMNYMLMSLLKAKSVLYSRDRNAIIPMATSTGE